MVWKAAGSWYTKMLAAATNLALCPPHHVLVLCIADLCPFEGSFCEGSDWLVAVDATNCPLDCPSPILIWFLARKAVRVLRDAHRTDPALVAILFHKLDTMPLCSCKDVHNSGISMALSWSSPPSLRALCKVHDGVSCLLVGRSDVE